MDRGRYLRHQGVEGLDIDRLRAMRVTVVGAGAVGNEVLKNLVLLGVGAIDVHDFDRVEIHNLTRSVFLREQDVGAGKAQSVVARAAQVDPNVRLRAVCGDAWRTLRLVDLARCDALICAVDNLEARMKLSQLCLLAGVDMVNAGIDSRSAGVEVFRFGAAGDSACFECHLPESAYRKVAERYSCGWLRRRLLAEQVVPTTAITASVAGALAVQAALRIGGEVSGSRRVMVDTRTGAATSVALDRNPQCVACGALSPRPRRVAAGDDWQRALGTHAATVEAVLLSDPIVFGCACTRCGPTPAAQRHVGRRADEFDDGIMRCPSCGQLSVQVDIRAEATVDDLRRLFGKSPLPAKFLLAGVGGPDAVCIDLEE
ncbi:MAG: ThiF family adenylyltransferase [Burkholderiaceae bacterium]|jgi:molybdopterin/thiamine biosynthesis adenylyltransferase|nr:ThiF family adenylyltransferase [Burkholderiaceae bacterium]